MPQGCSDTGELREALHQAADQIADYLGSLGSQPIFPSAPSAPEGDLFPEQGEGLSTLFSDCRKWAVDNALQVGHPGYVGHMDSEVDPAGILGDFLASALNQNLLAFELAPGATLLEKKLVRLFCDAAGLPEGSGGLFTTGGTGANLTGLLLARDASSHASHQGLSQEHPLCVLASVDAHYSIAKACAVLGMGSEQVIPVAVAGPERRMDPADLPKALERAHAKGQRPVAVVATAGTTSCGAIDPLEDVADFCAQEGLWMHVDGAHGGALLLHRKEKERLVGIHRADSITLDPHKWLYAPKSAGILLVRKEETLRTADYDAPYLDRFSEHGEALPVSQGRRALDGSRRFDALKVWMILRHLGKEGLEARLESRLQLTEQLHQTLAEHPFFMPCHRPDLNVQVFLPRDSAHRPQIAATHRALEQEGRFWSSYTRLDGQQCHRMVLLNEAPRLSDLTALMGQLESHHWGLLSPSEIPEHLSPKGRSESPPGLLHSSPDHRSKGGSHVVVGD